MSRDPPASRSEFNVWRRFTTRWADNDVYGHVNNTIFYQWFDSAVNGWLIDQGILGGEGPIGLVVETSCTYFVPLAFPQDVEVGLSVAELGRSSIRYRIGVFGERDGAVAQGEFVHVVVDRSSRRPVEIPAVWRTKLEAIS